MMAPRGGKRPDLDNRYFRSAWEANWARYLNWLKSIGAIRAWEFEVVTFTPDFKVTNNDGSVEFHEIKGWMDDRSATKLKRMTKYHPAVKVLVIGQPEYRAVSKKVAGMIPNWEVSPKKGF